MRATSSRTIVCVNELLQVHKMPKCVAFCMHYRPTNHCTAAECSPVRGTTIAFTTCRKPEDVEEEQEEQEEVDGAYL